jgi:hypothetical protein
VLLDRGYGKAEQAINPTITNKRASDMSKAELDEAIAQAMALLAGGVGRSRSLTRRVTGRRREGAARRLRERCLEGAAPQGSRPNARCALGHDRHAPRCLHADRVPELYRQRGYEFV